MQSRRLPIATALATVTVLAHVGGSLASASEAAPSLALTSATANRKPPRANVFLNFCAAIGPGARIITSETRLIGRRVVARHVSVDPLGVDLTTIYPRACTTRYQIGWVVSPRLMGPGVYSVSLRIEDGYGKLSKPVGFFFNAGG